MGPQSSLSLCLRVSCGGSSHIWANRPFPGAISPGPSDVCLVPRAGPCRLTGQELLGTASRGSSMTRMELPSPWALPVPRGSGERQGGASSGPLLSDGHSPAWR